MLSYIKFRQIRLILLLAFVFLNSSGGKAQPIPRPVVWYQLDYSGFVAHGKHKSAYDSAMSYNIVNTNWEINRFGSYYAVYTDNNSHTSGIRFSNKKKSGHDDFRLFGALHGDSSFPKNFTISLWIYVNPNDTIKRTIFRMGNSPNGADFGLYHRGQSLFLQRSVTRDGYDKAYYDYFFGAPASLDVGAGWYHVIMVMGERDSDKAKYTKLYIGKPQKKKYTIIPTDHLTPLEREQLAYDFGGSYAFTGINAGMSADNQYWSLGNLITTPGSGRSVRAVSDLAVWKIALTDNQAKALFRCQQTNIASACWSSSPGPSSRKDSALTASASTLLDDSMTTEESLGTISVFPNPTTGDLFIKIPGRSNQGEMEITLLDLNGKTVHKRSVAGKAGFQTVTIQDLKSITRSSGIYFLKLTSASHSQTFKIVVQ